MARTPSSSPEPASRWPGQLAAIDMGSNSFRLEIGQLVEIRKARLKQLGMPVDAGYGLIDQVKQELDYAQSIFRAHPSWPVIDVTGRAIEETAVIVLESLKERDDAAKQARAKLVSG